MNKPDLDFGKLYLIDEDGVPHTLCEITDVEETEDRKAIVSPSEEFNEAMSASMCAGLMTGAMDYCDYDRSFLKQAQNSAKKYKRNKTQYKFWKDQEFVGNNRAGRRRK